jgi:hypothetical protein
MSALQSLASRNPKACGLLQVAPGVFARIDCQAYAPSQRAVASLSPRKALALQNRTTQWQPIRLFGARFQQAMAQGFTVAARPPVRSQAADPLHSRAAERSRAHIPEARSPAGTDRIQGHTEAARWWPSPGIPRTSRMPSRGAPGLQRCSISCSSSSIAPVPYVRETAQRRWYSRHVAPTSGAGPGRAENL